MPRLLFSKWGKQTVLGSSLRGLAPIRTRMRFMPFSINDEVRTLTWAHGRANVQRLGAMLGPLVFRAAGHVDFEPLHVAPWAGEQGADGLPGILRRLRGEWPCVPFGRVDPVPKLPPGWTSLQPDDEWSHGYGSHHEWTWLPTDDPLTLRLSLLYPPGSPVHRLTRTISALADSPALEISLQIEVRRRCDLPVALHPIVRLDLGSLAVRVPHRDLCLTYPVSTVPDVSRLAPNAQFAGLSRAPAVDGSEIDLSRYPQAVDSEELVQLLDVTGPVELDYLEQGWKLELAWDLASMPDVMLWISHRGRHHVPWNGRHLALGVEPLNSVFDLGRVAMPPSDHPMAQRRGIALDSAHPHVICYSIRATAK
jgi:hypothetical protein